MKNSWHILFGRVFKKSVLYNSNYGWAGRRLALSEVYLLFNLLSKLFVTFILQWIAFIFGRDEEEDQ